MNENILIHTLYSYEILAKNYKNLNNFCTGVEKTHSDIAPNYDHAASYDINDNDNDPTPRYNGQNSHGTRCAGEIAMAANNKKCGVGVAFEASIGGIRLLDGRISDVSEGRSLLFNIQHIDIFSASWGPSDDGETVDGPKKLAAEALLRGVTHGRGGKGIIYVWASGNGGSKGDNCNCDGYTNSIFTLSIGSASEQGLFPWYGEQCSSTIAVAYSSGTFSEQKISTTDLYNKCTTEHTGTSAAAPLAAGVIALVLQANPDLSWRDVQHLVVITSEFKPLRNNKGWKRNSAGLMYNSRFGFGLLNAEAMVNAALKWTSVPVKTVCAVAVRDRLPKVISAREMTTVSFESNGCSQSANEINIMEHVQVTVTIAFPRRGFLNIYLQSPSGAVSMLLSQRPRDKSGIGFTNWTFTTVHFWGEKPRGHWKLIIRVKSGHNYIGNLTYASLLCHGTREIPEHLKNKRVYEDEELIPHVIDSTPEYREANYYDQNSMVNSLEPIANLPQLFNWNDYGESLIPLMNYRSDRKFQP
ncbi:Neuroendocrine convertase 1-like protein, partial [Leptotrombidium deliense]